MGSREERELVFRKGKWIDYPFEPCWNEYWLYASDRIVQQPLLRLEDIAAHLWLCARYHPDHPDYSEYTWAELAAVWLAEPSRLKPVKTIVARLQAAGLVDVQPGKGRGNGNRFIPYDPLMEPDFRLAAARGCFGVPAQDRVRAGLSPVELAAFDFNQVRESYRVQKPRSFVRGRGWEPCLRTVFDLYLGTLVDTQEQDGQAWVPLPGADAPGDITLAPWDGPPLARGRAVVRLTTAPLLDLAAIALALWLRKRADQARLQREPWVTVSVSQIRRFFHLRWTAAESLLAALETAGLARRVGGGRQAGDNKANVALRFLLWDPCENTADFLREVAVGEICTQLSPLGAAAMAQLSPANQSQNGAKPLEAADQGEEKPSAWEQGGRKPSKREQGGPKKPENPPNGNKGNAENHPNRNKGGKQRQPENGENPAETLGCQPEKPSVWEQHVHVHTNNGITTTTLSPVVVALLSEIEMGPGQLPRTVSRAEIEEMAIALAGIQPGQLGYDSRREIARAWLQRGPPEALLTYLAIAAGVRSTVARKKGLADLAFDYVRAVTECVWAQVHGTPDYKYLAARVVKWLEAQDPLPEARARQLRFQLAEDAASPDQQNQPPPPGPTAAPVPAPVDAAHAAYAELLGVPLDLTLWAQVLQEVRRLGLAPPDWAAGALLDRHGPRRAGRGEQEVWLLVPDDVDLDAAGRYLGEEGVGKVIEQIVRRRARVALPVAVGHYTDLVNYLRKLQNRARSAWEQIKKALARQLSRSDYVTWVEQTRGGALHLGERRLTVYSPPPALPWLRQAAFRQQAQRFAQEVLGVGWSVEFRPVASGSDRRG